MEVSKVVLEHAAKRITEDMINNTRLKLYSRERESYDQISDTPPKEYLDLVLTADEPIVTYLELLGESQGLTLSELISEIIKYELKKKKEEIK